MDDELTIRRARREDVEALAPFARQAFRDAYRLIDDPDDIEAYVADAFTPEAFAAILDDAESTLFVASVGSQLTGYARVARTVPPPCVTGPNPVELARLYLRSEAIGKGYGAALMREVFAEARRRHGGTLWLSVYDRNVRAVEFYKRWGFRDVGKKDVLFAGKQYADPVMAAPVAAPG